MKIPKTFHSLPWDQTTLLGWTVETIISVLAGCAYLLINNTFMSFFVGICYYHRAFRAHIEELIEKIDYKNGQRKAKSILTETIQFHYSARR